LTLTEPSGTAAAVRVAAFIQARMSSRRFPGKMLAPFRGRPILDHVVDAVRRGVPDAPLVVLTSEEPSDEPLAVYARSRGVEVFRGPLDDVLGRFRRALDAVDARSPAPAEWVLRICGDSPLLSGAVIRRVIDTARGDGETDLVTTTLQRTFPRGQNAELLRASTLRRLDDDAALTAENREHVTHAIHVHPERYRAVNVASGDPALAARHHAVDTVDDLVRLEAADLDLELAGIGR
jgi:spore coat polysaccharide biosynthesis protein SpsF